MARGWRCLTVEGLSPSQLLLVPPDVAPCGADELTPLAQRQSQLVFAPLGIPRRDVLIFNPGEGKKRKGSQDARFSRSSAARQGDTPSQECAGFTCGERRGRDS